MRSPNGGLFYCLKSTKETAMIYAIEAAYAQEVLRINYEYADVIVHKRGRLAARTMGIVRHDRFLAEHDISQRDIDIRRTLSSDYIRVGKITTIQ